MRYVFPNALRWSLLLLSTFVLGCGGPWAFVDLVYLTEERFPPKLPDAFIKVYDASVIGPKADPEIKEMYYAIARFEMQPDPFGSPPPLNPAILKARELGGDAIIYYPREKVTGDIIVGMDKTATPTVIVLKRKTG